jgi:hypothetical protein
MMFLSGLSITSYIFDWSENFDLCYKTHSVVFYYMGSQFTTTFSDKIHTVHNFFMHEAYPYSLEVYMVLHCVHFLWLFL